MSINHYSSATEMLAALDNREVSSAELTEMCIARIQSVDPDLNAIPVTTYDRARESAAIADKRRADGESSALLGLPMTLKESTLVKGLPQTAGIEALEGYLPQIDGSLATRLFDAGINLLGKTNIPTELSDWQADSPVYGRTNNPWDLSRTPGGSTGGGGAALASGMTPLELGSDIGGSIRIPAAYCGVYGHRPSETALPRSGAFPLADAPNPAFLLGVQGPLARSAGDLELAFDVLKGAEAGEDTAWRLAIPAPRHDNLKDYRVGILTHCGDLRPAASMLTRMEELAGFLTSEGASVVEVETPFDINLFMRQYTTLLVSLMSLSQPDEVRQTTAAEYRKLGDPIMDAYADGLTASASSYIMAVAAREQYKQAWADFFTGYDIVLAPTTLDAAFPHKDGDMMARSLLVDNVEIPYFSNIFFSSLAIYTGLPATAFPAGLNDEGLPLGFQAIGPYLEDKSTIRFAQLLERAWYRFQPPPAYA